jgi:hypothetical protein
MLSLNMTNQQAWHYKRAFHEKSVPPWLYYLISLVYMVSMGAYGDEVG